MLQHTRMIDQLAKLKWLMAKTYCYTKQAQCCVSEGFQGKMKNALQSQLQLKMFDALMCQFDEGIQVSI